MEWNTWGYKFNRTADHKKVDLMFINIESVKAVTALPTTIFFISRLQVFVETDSSVNYSK